MKLFWTGNNMALTLKESKAITEIARLLHDYLPGSGSPSWKGHVSFKTVAEKVGVGAFWRAGSKIPMITNLFERTLEFRRDRFEPLILEIVRAGLVYRQKQNTPIKPEEIDVLNGLILEIGFKFPALWDPDFRASLSLDGNTLAKAHIEKTLAEEALRASKQTALSKELEDLKNVFYGLHRDTDRQGAGFKLERVLNRLFELYGLSPREPFRVAGEQIDGSFELDHEIYLLEAKWQQRPCSESDLLVFRGKIEGKSQFTRGVFVAINGISKDADVATTRGKQPTFFVADGYDITMLLENHVDLVTFLRLRQRLLAEEGRISVAFNKIDFSQ